MLNKNTIACMVLIQIRHNGKNYQVGDVVYLSENDKLFLEKAKYVRTATPIEVSQFEQKQDDENQAGADNPPKANLNSPLNESQTNSDSDTPIADTVFGNKSVLVQDYGKLTKAQLVNELIKRQIPHNPKAKNDELEALLVADDKA